MSLFHWLLLPALVISNCAALYTAYSYKRAYDAVHSNYSAYLRAKEQRRTRLLREKSEQLLRRQPSKHRQPQTPTKDGSRSQRPPSSSPSTPPAVAASAHSAELASSDAEDEGGVAAATTADAVSDIADAPTTVDRVEPPRVDPLHLAFHPHSSPSRVVHNEDALQWLQSQAVLPGCVVTSLPDVSEVPMGQAAWRCWFIDAVCEVIQRLPPDGLAFFYQTDVRMKGEWVDKSHLLCLGGEKAGARLIWHKVVVQNTVHTIKGTKASYAHLLCFAPLPLTAASSPRPFVERSSTLSPDLLLSRGFMQWKRAMGLLACDFCCGFIQQHTQHRTVVDPFCGQGSVLAVANARGMDAVGVDIGARRCKMARRLDVRGKDFRDDGKEVGEEEERVGEQGMTVRRRLKRLRKEQERLERERVSNGAGKPPPLQEAGDLLSGLTLLDTS